MSFCIVLLSQAKHFVHADRAIFTVLLKLLCVSRSYVAPYPERELLLAEFKVRDALPGQGTSDVSLKFPTITVNQN